MAGLGSVAAIISVLVKTTLDPDSINKVNKSIEGSITNAGDKAGKGFLKGNAPHIAQLAKAIGGAFVVREISKFGKDSIDAFKNTAMEAAKLQRIAGGTAEEMSRLNFAAKESGITTDKLSLAFKFLSRSASNALSDIDKQKMKGDAVNKSNKEYSDKAWAALYKHKNVTNQMVQATKDMIAAHEKQTPVLGKNALAFEKLGVNLVDSKGKQKDLKDILLDTAEAFKKMPAGVDKSALAMKLFGRSGLELLPFLNRGKTGISEFMKESDKFGATINDTQVQAVKDAALAQRQFHEALEGVKIQIGANLFPIVTKFMNYFRTTLLPIIIGATKAFKEHGKEIGIVAIVLGSFIGIVKGIIAAQKAWTAVQTAFNIVMGLNPIGLAVIAIAALVAGVIYAYNHFKSFRDFIKEFGKIAKAAFELAFAPLFLAVKAIEAIAKGPIGKVLGSIVNKIVGKAIGGPVMPNQTYLVGEKGPELFSPNTSGQIIPNHRITTGQGGDNYNIVVNNPKTELSSTSIPNALRRTTYLKGKP